MSFLSVDFCQDEGNDLAGKIEAPVEDFGSIECFRSINPPLRFTGRTKGVKIELYELLPKTTPEAFFDIGTDRIRAASDLFREYLTAWSLSHRSESFQSKLYK